MNLGARAAEVYWKEGRSIRLALAGGAKLTEAWVEEEGIAIRAWGPDGGMGFASFVPADDTGLEFVLGRVAMEMKRSGEGAPDLPAAVPGGVQSGSGGPLWGSIEGLVEGVRDGLRRAVERFNRPGLGGVRLEGAWCEAGGNRVHLLNSSGFDGRQDSQGWHLALAARAKGRPARHEAHAGPAGLFPRERDATEAATGRRGGERIGYLARGGSSIEEMAPEDLVEELAWRTAAPQGGLPASSGSMEVVVDTAIASQILRSVSPFLTAGGDSLEALKRGRRVGPASLGLADRIRPGLDGPWDGEGVPRRSVDLVREGRLVGLLTDLTSGRRYGLPLTGSAVRRSFRDRPEAGASRLVLSWQGEEVEMAGLLGRLRPGPFLTTGRFIPAVSGPGGAVVGGGIWMDGGRALNPVRGAVVKGDPLALLASLAAACPAASGIGTEEAESGSILIRAHVSPF
jgi:predicted Zn-dependent protease